MENNMHTYDLKGFALRVRKSSNLIYRRLTEKPPRYCVRFARREGGRWVWDRQKVDAAIEANESLIVRLDRANVLTDEAALKYLYQ
jgi:hypothetical protein